MNFKNCRLKVKVGKQNRNKLKNKKKNKKELINHFKEISIINYYFMLNN